MAMAHDYDSRNGIAALEAAAALTERAREVGRIVAEVRKIQNTYGGLEFLHSEVCWETNTGNDAPPYQRVHVHWEEPLRRTREVDHFNVVFPISYLWQDNDLVRLLEAKAEGHRQNQREAERARQASEAAAAQEERDRRRYEELKRHFEGVSAQ